MKLVKALLTLFALLSATLSFAGAPEDANAALAHWAAAYTANDVEVVVASYWPDAVLLGTVSPIMSEGETAIRSYFTSVIKPGNKNVIGDRRTIVLDDSAVLITGFYEFTRMRDGVAVQGPSRFTMLMVKRGNEWRIRHHHSSPHVQPIKAPQ